MTKQSAGKYIVSEQMNNEWNRFSSFSAFPLKSRAMPLRLAQAGFFYSGYDEEAICFHCGLNNNTWSDDEAVTDVHIRLSPQCGFIRGEGTNNIAINGDKALTSASRSVRGQKTDSYQNELRQDVETQNCSVSVSGNASASVDSKTKHLLNYSQAKYQSMQQSKNHADRKKDDMAVNVQHQLYPGVGDEKPKHPDYMLENIRVSSFAKWPATSTLKIQPQDLARAGFFYTGYSDCVRCFFCGGGLNSWDSEDNPWVEHAKWLPDCAYVKLCKGQAFVNMCTAAISSGLLRNDEIRTYNGLENIPEDWLIEHLNSSAARHVLAEGFHQQDVERAILFAGKRYGHEEVISQHIMEFMHQTNAVETSTLQSDLCNHFTHKHDASAKQLAENQKPLQTFEGTDNTFQTIDIPDTNKSEKEKLFEENRKLKDLATCKVCMDNEACVAFLPCGHLTSCVNCAKSLQKCAICRAEVLGTIRVFQC